MKIIPYLLVGNHPKTAKLKERIIRIIKLLKENGGKMEAEELEKKLELSRVNDPSLFYKPLASMRKWDLVQSHRRVEIDDAGKKKFRTTYELTTGLFYHYIEKTLIELAKKELEMV
jgi:hypothetical protein